MTQKNLKQGAFKKKKKFKISVVIYTCAWTRIFFSSVSFEMIKSSSFDRELSRLKFSESEEDSGKEKKTTQHETKEVASNPNSRERIQNFDNFDIMYRKLKK